MAEALREAALAVGLLGAPTWVARWVRETFADELDPRCRRVGGVDADAGATAGRGRRQHARRPPPLLAILIRAFQAGVVAALYLRGPG
jgi:hypothetical protein